MEWNGMEHHGMEHHGMVGMAGGTSNAPRAKPGLQEGALNWEHFGALCSFCSGTTGNSVIFQAFGSGDCCGCFPVFGKSAVHDPALDRLWLCFPFAGFEILKGGRSQVVELGWESEASALLQAQIWAGGVSVRWNPWVWGAGGARENLELLTGALSPHSQELQLHPPSMAPGPSRAG